MDIFTKLTTVVAMVTDERDEISQDEQVTWVFILPLGTNC